MSTSEIPPPSERATIHRLADRASYDPAEAYAILDAGFVAHVGFTTDDGAVVLPMAYARDGDRLLMHGSAESRLMTSAASGIALCVTVTLVDGIVLGRSEFRHGINCRSVVAYGVAHTVEDSAEKKAALNRFVEQVIPGRTTQAEPPRTPDDLELGETGLLTFPLEEMSVKIRSGGPLDEHRDLGLSVWAGVLPLAVATGAPIPDPIQVENPPAGGPPPVPDYVTNYRRP